MGRWTHTYIQERLATESHCGVYSTRVVVPAKELAVICQFHDGKRACVRTDNGEQSVSFGVMQGLHTTRLRVVAVAVQRVLCCCVRRCSSTLHRGQRHSKGFDPRREGCGGRKRCESIETTVRKRRPFLAGVVGAATQEGIATDLV